MPEVVKTASTSTPTPTPTPVAAHDRIPALIKAAIIGATPGTILIIVAALLPDGLARRTIEAVGAALIGAGVAVPAIEFRGHARLIDRIAEMLRRQHDELAEINRHQHETLAEITDKQHKELAAINAKQLSLNQEQHDALARITEKQHEELAKINERQLSALTARADEHIGKLMSIVGTKAEEVLPAVLEEVFRETPPEAKLFTRTWSFVKAVMALEKKESWTDDVSIRFVGALLKYVSENATSFYSVARQGGLMPITLPVSSASLADQILSAQMNIMNEGDEYIVLSDLSSWSGELTLFHAATVNALERRVRIRRLICPFDYDEALSEATVKSIFEKQWLAALDAGLDERGRPYYELAAIRREAIAARQIHHTGIFWHGTEGVSFQPQHSNLAEMLFSKTERREPVYMSELWVSAQHNVREHDGATEFIDADKAWLALGSNWWRS